MQILKKLSAFSGKQLSALALLFCFLMFGTWFAAYKINYQNEEALFNYTTNTVTRSVDIGIEQARALISSVSALHYSMSSSDPEEMSEFLVKLRRQNRFITSIGRFKKETGEALYPLTHISPITPFSEIQAGFDLSSIESLNQLIESAIETKEISTDRLPSIWPTNGSLLLFTPSYTEIISAIKNGVREQYADGGYLMALNLAKLLNSADDIKSGKIGYQINLTNQLGTQTIDELEPVPTSEGIFSFLDTAFKSKREWTLGSSRIAIELTTNIGMSPTLRSALLGASLAGILFFVLITLGLYEKQVAKNERNRNIQLVHAEREKAVKTLNAISDSVVTLDMQKNIVNMNPAAERLLDSKLKDIENYPIQNFFSFTAIETSLTEYDVSQQINDLAVGEEHTVDLQFKGAGDTTRTIKMSITHTLNSDGFAIGYIMVLSDVTTERALTAELEYLANHDSLTGCANRYFFESKLSALLDDLKYSGRRHAMCYIDLDQFKVINDTCGHTAGDKLLCDLVDHLEYIVRDRDLLARLGGDEFGLIITDAEGEEAEQVAQAVYDFFQTYVFQYGDHAFAIRASIGFVNVNEHSESITAIFAAADVALYASKDGGRNTLSYYSEANESMHSRHEEKNWLPQLNHALQHDRFKLLVQAVAPIGAKSEANHPLHFEFLLRMLDENNKEISPFFFIPAAERYELMAQIDRWVLKNCMKLLSKLPSAELNNCTFSINLSGQSVADESLTEFIQTQMSEFNIPPEQIWFELTETAAIKQFSNAKVFMEAMRTLGCKVALDDFGSGLSSFGYLKNLPIDVLKIDGQFVKDMHNNVIDREMVRSFNNIGKAMGITTVAEFVENKEIMDILEEIGVDYAQGYFIGKPCSVEDALESLSDTRRVA